MHEHADDKAREITGSVLRATQTRLLVVVGDLVGEGVV